MTVKKDSPKYREALESLPEGLRGEYEKLVDAYAFHTMTHYGRGYVAYKVLAALILDGWRRPTDQAGA